MKSGYFIASVLGGAFAAAVLQGVTQTSAPGIPRKSPAGDGIFNGMDEKDMDKLFSGELEKLRQSVPPLRLRTFEEACDAFESALSTTSEYVRTQAVLGFVMSVMSVNSYRGRSEYVPAGLSFDNILRCEEDILAIVRQESCGEALEKAIKTLYFHLKRF